MGGLSGREFESPHLQTSGMIMNRVDVRIVKTKERLRRALLDLMVERGLDEISISEVCDKAGVNRNTFYSHYASVKALLEEIEAQFLEELIKAINISSESVNSVKGLLTLILEKVRENRDMCMLIFSEHGDKNFLRSILTFFLPNAVRNWADNLHLPEKDASLLFYFISGGAVSIIEEWVRGGFDWDDKDIVEKLDSMIMMTQKAFLSSY